MERRSFELVHAGNVRHPRSIERSGAADNNVGLDDICPAVRRTNLNRPCCGRVIPGRLRHLSIEATLFINAVFAHHALKVRTQFGLSAEVFAPMVGGFERIAIKVTANVHTSSGVAIVSPCSSGPIGLLDDRVRNARLIKTNARQETGLTTTDDNDMKRVANVCRNFVLPGDCSTIGTIEMKVIGKHRHNRGIHRRGRHEVHQFFDQFR